jgi:hypothetical protein
VRRIGLWTVAPGGLTLYLIHEVEVESQAKIHSDVKVLTLIFGLLCFAVGCFYAAWRIEQRKYEPTDADRLKYEMANSACMNNDIQVALLTSRYPLRNIDIRYMRQECEILEAEAVKPSIDEESALQKQRALVKY